MKLLYSSILLIMLTLTAKAQKPSKVIYLELGGPGFLSANFDGRFTNSNKGLGYRLGIGAIADPYTAGVTIPTGINYLLGYDESFLELGLGVSFVHMPNNINQDQPFNFPKKSFLTPYGWLGYRHQPLDKGFNFRAGLCPFFRDINIPKLIIAENLFAGISFGYTFK